MYLLKYAPPQKSLSCISHVQCFMILSNSVAHVFLTIPGQSPLKSNDLNFKKSCGTRPMCVNVVRCPANVTLHSVTLKNA